jgi:chromosome segregation ATPase
MCKTVKKVAVIGLLAMGAVWASKHTPVGREVCSYVRTWWTRSAPSTEKFVSRDFEIDRVANDINDLKAERDSLLRPIAAKQAYVNRLKREIDTARTNFKVRRENFCAVLQEVKAGTEVVAHNGGKLSLKAAKVFLAREDATLKRLDKQLTTKEQLLAAQQQDVDAAKKELDNLEDQIDELNLILTKLRLTEQQIQVQQAALPQGVDRNRIAAIRAKLERIGDAQEEETIRLELLRPAASRNAARNAAPPQDLNLAEMETFWGVQTAPGKVAAGN